MIGDAFQRNLRLLLVRESRDCDCPDVIDWMNAHTADEVWHSREWLADHIEAAAERSQTVFSRRVCIMLIRLACGRK